MRNVIIRFDVPYAFLSNFSPAEVVLDGVTYPTVENAFQAAKTLNAEERLIFQNCSPNYAKTTGRALAQLRPDWNDVREDVMRDLLKQKFAPGSSYAKSLLSTGDAFLCEGNTWHDNYWGACNCPRCTYTTHQNVLGNLLMEIRDSLREGR